MIAMLRIVLSSTPRILGAARRYLENIS
jgi:hypothetical protein